MNLRAPHGRGGLLVGAVVGYVVAVCAALAVVVWTSLTPAQRESLRETLGTQTATVVLGSVLALAGLVALLANVLGRYPPAARRLAADTRLLLGANPDHRLNESGPPELRELAAAVNALAEQRRVAEQEVAQQVRAARVDVETERNRLAALMADLTVAVVVCSPGGRILLYNAATRSLLTDDPALGLGRSVFGIVDRGLVTHALDRIHDGSGKTQVATALRDRRLLGVRVAPVIGGEGDHTGFVLLLEDLTSRLEASSRRDALLRELIETTRASLASIRAAVETVLDYPDMAPEERTQFVEIVRDESQRLGGRVETWVAGSAAHLGADWLLTDMRGQDLLTVLGRELDREIGVAAAVEPVAEELWVRADSHALGRAAVHLVGRLRDGRSVGSLTLTLALSRVGRHAGLDLRWTGRAPDLGLFKAWSDEPLTGGAAASAQEVVGRHDGEMWCGDGPEGTAYLRLLLPLSDPAPEPATLGARASRPEFYDFDLFDLPEGSLSWQERQLSDLPYTVFDTETTGFDPKAGDEIVAIGAVRVVNARLLRHETFERLVNPRRSVPARSTAVHGITAEMLCDQPTIDVVLPQFARFTEDTVLVGHNVGFDMSFLLSKEAQTGVRLTQPVLDTLLLDAALHPDHEHHSLEAIAARLGVDVVGRHTALGDALLTGEVFVRLLALLQQRGIRTLGEALAAARATYLARLDASMYGR